MNKNILLAVLTAAMLAFSTSASAFFWDDDDWDDPWDDNDWAEFTPMYWMEEFADEMDDDDDDYYRYGPRPYYGGYGYGYPQQPQPYQYPQQAPVPQAPAAPQQ